MPPTPPIVLCMLLCDGIHIDPRTGERFLLGTTTKTELAAVGGGQGVIWLYAELTNGHGPTPIQIRLVRAAPGALEGRVIIATDMPLEFTSPREVLYTMLRFHPALSSEPAEHRVILSSRGLDLLERRLEVLRRSENGSR